MTEDVDMDAPQISTLREETTPEPNPARSKFRVKLLVNDKAESSKAGSTSSKHGRPDSDDDDEEDDEDEEEDQLIDDDNDEVMKALPSIPPQVVTPVVATPSKRGGRGRGRGGRGRGRGGRAGAPVPGPGVTWFETAPSEAISSQDARSDVWDPSLAAAGSTVPTPARKKPGPPKGSTINRTVRKKASKSAKSVVSLLKDDADSVSEAYAGTAASSPIPHEGSPEPEMPLSSAIPPHHPMDDTPLEGVPLPVYPLPSKPFPVQPPPKIGAGFAPVIPLDKSGKSVRKWRQVNREIRGIAGGRWFVKSWVGEKESEFANAVAASQAAAQAIAGDNLSAAGLTLPNLSSISISGTGRGRGRGARHGVGHASTVASSRAGSAMPESISAQPKKRGSGPSTPSIDLPPTPIPISAPPVV